MVNRSNKCTSLTLLLGGHRLVEWRGKQSRFYKTWNTIAPGTNADIAPPSQSYTLPYNHSVPTWFFLVAFLLLQDVDWLWTRKKMKRNRREVPAPLSNRDLDGIWDPSTDNINIANDPYAIYCVYTKFISWPLLFAGAFRQNKQTLSNDYVNNDSNQGFRTHIATTLTSSRSRRYILHCWVTDPLGQSFWRSLGWISCYFSIK